MRVHRAIVRDLVVLLVACLAIVVAAEFRTLPSPTYARHTALADDLEDVYRDQRAGVVAFDEEPREVAPGVQAALVNRGRWTVVGQVDDTCYGMWWDDAGERHIRVVAPMRACTPDNGSDPRPATVATSTTSSPETADRANWDAILPDPISIHLWWWPLLVVALYVVLSATVRVIVQMVTSGSWRGQP